MIIKVNLYLKVEGTEFEPTLLREVLENRIYAILDDQLSGRPPRFNLDRLALSKEAKKGLKEVQLLTKDEALASLR